MGELGGEEVVGRHRGVEGLPCLVGHRLGKRVAAIAGRETTLVAARRAVCQGHLLAVASETALVHRLDAAQIDQGVDERLRIGRVAIQRQGELVGGEATACVDERERERQALVLRERHAADARVAAQKRQRRAVADAAALAHVRLLGAIGHAHVELGHAHARETGDQGVSALMHDDDDAQDEQEAQHSYDDVQNLDAAL